MKLVIVADIHGNHDAMRALPEKYDELWVLGHLVNYGPEPREVVEQVKLSATVVVTTTTRSPRTTNHNGDRATVQWLAAKATC